MQVGGMDDGFQMHHPSSYRSDSSGARGILQRQGVGRVRHLSCKNLWLQNLTSSGDIKLACVAGAHNPADIGTKRLTSSRLRSLMAMLVTCLLVQLKVLMIQDAFTPKRQNLMSIVSA